MPRISLYKENHSNDYKFQDRRILEVFTMSGVGINIHKYIGVYQQTGTNDATQPTYSNNSERNIQDLLFLENRDRKYDKSVYNMRGHYTIQDNDFNLSQFGMFLTNDTIYITFHINDMVQRLGRKIIAGDVFELPHLRDYWPLDDSIPVALKKFYVVQETSRAAEGFAQTWWPHLWRCKCAPMVDGQEYRDILDAEATDASGNPVSTGSSLRDMLSSYTKSLEINTAVIQQAEADVPASGYDTTHLFQLPTVDGIAGNPLAVSSDTSLTFADTIVVTTDLAVNTALQAINGYLVGDGKAPNNLPVTADIAFPANPYTGQFVLRLDYFPNRLFKWDGIKWVTVQDVNRQAMTGTKNQNQLGTFVNNDKTTRTNSGNQISQRQLLSTLLKPQTDQ